MSPRTIERYVSRVLNFGEVKANTIERLLNSMAMHPHVEFFTTEAVHMLEHPVKTLSEIAHDVYTEMGSDFALASIFYYLKRNRCSYKKVCWNFSALESIFHSYLTSIKWWRHKKYNLTMEQDLPLKELALAQTMISFTTA